jgi:ABC-type lipoprotein export system ATPase subunit
MSEENRKAEPLISLRGVSKHYRDGDVWALENVSLDIFAGDYLAVMGPSGSGKSTMLNMMGALDRPSSGQVLLRGSSLDENTNLDRVRARELGFVFQSYYLLPNLTAIENVQIPMFEGDQSREQRRDEAFRLLQLVGLEDRINHLPSQLSIGQRQRVAVARALANGPSLILADEPTGALDSKSGDEIMGLLSQLNHEHGTTLVIVTHDQSVAERANQIIHLMDGKIVDE